jgi:hypothetical protein
MRQRAVAACAAVLLLIGVAGGADPASAEPTITVSPDTGLVDGQIVTVTAGGFTPGSTIASGQCPASAVGVTDPFELQRICGSVATWREVDGTGTTQFEMPVLRELPDGVDCAIDACIILVGDAFAGGPYVHAAISMVDEPVVPAEVTVTPTSGLLDGQTVAVAGSGFTPNFPVLVTQCSSAAAGVTDLVQLGYLCASPTNADVGVDGTFTFDLQVHREFAAVWGPVITCGVEAGDCVVAVLQGATGDRVDTPITFAPPTPSSVADCLHGGWRERADAAGRPFPTLGACLRFVAEHRSPG